MNVILSASLMCMDFLNAGESMNTLNRHCGMLHADIMDGHYAKNLALSPSFIKSVRASSALPIDAHLMVTTPSDFIESVAAAGADYISLHAETVNVNAFRLLSLIKKLGCKTGIVLNPATPVTFIEHYFELIDMLTIMTVDIGYAGQPFIDVMPRKISQAAEIIQKSGYECVIQVDGACNKNTYKQLYDAGARAFVMGSTGLFGLDADLETACLRMKDEFSQETGAAL